MGSELSMRPELSMGSEGTQLSTGRGQPPCRHPVGRLPAAVTSRTHGVFASARLLFWTSQVP